MGFFFFQAEDGIRDYKVTGVQTCALPIYGRLQVAVHCGAQSTWDTAQLAAHAADVGADGVAVMAPPYFTLDETELFSHFDSAARACAPTPFYVYEFASRSGYPVPVAFVQRLRVTAP